MGNQNVYGEGHFISPNKISKPQLKLDEKQFNIENIFGRLDIPTTRAQKADDTIVEDLKISYMTKIDYYEHSERIAEDSKPPKQPHYHKSVLAEKKNELRLPESHYIEERKAKTEVENSNISKNSSSGIEKYMSRQDSPIKQ